MTSHLHRDMTALRGHILSMGGLVEQAVREATEALEQRDAERAREVIEKDRKVDVLEVEIDDECLKILALHQPVAGDLRFLTSTIKINSDLERIGDLATNIAERALDLISLPAIYEPLGFAEMTEGVQAMLRDSLDALVHRNSELARDIISRDDTIDGLNRSHFDAMEERMRGDPECVSAAMHLLSASRHLERIADLATNIAEDVIFLVEAVDIRHHGVSAQLHEKRSAT